MDQDDEGAQHRVLGQRTDPRSPEHVVGQGVSPLFRGSSTLDLEALTRESIEPATKEAADALIVKTHHLVEGHRSRKRRRLVAVRARGEDKARARIKTHHPCDLGTHPASMLLVEHLVEPVEQDQDSTAGQDVGQAWKLLADFVGQKSVQLETGLTLQAGSVGLERHQDRDSFIGQPSCQRSPGDLRRTQGQSETTNQGALARPRRP